MWCRTFRPEGLYQLRGTRDTYVAQKWLLQFKFCCLLFWREFTNITSAKMFRTYQYKIIVFSKLQTLNPQTSISLQIAKCNYRTHFWLYGTVCTLVFMGFIFHRFSIFADFVFFQFAVAGHCTICVNWCLMFRGWNFRRSSCWSANIKPCEN